MPEGSHGTKPTLRCGVQPNGACSVCVRVSQRIPRRRGVKLPDRPRAGAQGCSKVGRGGGPPGRARLGLWMSADSRRRLRQGFVVAVVRPRWNCCPEPRRMVSGPSRHRVSPMGGGPSVRNERRLTSAATVRVRSRGRQTALELLSRTTPDGKRPQSSQSLPDGDPSVRDERRLTSAATVVCPTKPKPFRPNRPSPTLVPPWRALGRWVSNRLAGIVARPSQCGAAIRLQLQSRRAEIPPDHPESDHRRSCGSRGLPTGAGWSSARPDWVD
jgi:hypothetical protein